MSKSMNKYHKCMSELGSSLPGWVKVGAVALGIGVGMGGWSPGGGGKMWAGSASEIVIRKKSHQGLVFQCRVLDTGESGMVTLYKDRKPEVVQDSSVVESVSHSSSNSLFRFGALTVIYENGELLLYQSSDDSLRIDSTEEITLPVARRFRAKMLVIANAPRVRIGSAVCCSVAAFPMCGEVSVEKVGSLYCGICFSDARMQLEGAFHCDVFCFYGGCRLSGSGILGGVSEHGGWRLVKKLQGFDVSASGLGYLHNADSNDPFSYWYPYEAEPWLPFAGGTSAQEDFKNKVWHCDIRGGGRYCFVFVANLMDCGDRNIEKKICMSVQEVSGNILGKAAQRVMFEGAKWKRVIFPIDITLEGEFARVMFGLSEDSSLRFPGVKIDSQEPPMLWIVCSVR